MAKAAPQLARLTRPRLHNAVARGFVTGGAGRLRGDRDTFALSPFAGTVAWGPLEMKIDRPGAASLPRHSLAAFVWGPGLATAFG
jgi:hypothetical protein